MFLRHTFALTLSNANLILKVFVYSAIVVLIGAAIFLSVLSPVLDAVGGEFNLIDFVDHVGDNIVFADGSFYNAMLDKIGNLSVNHPSEVTEIIVISVVVMMLLKFCFALIQPAIAYVINHKMATNYNESFFHAFTTVGVKGLGVAGLYTLISSAFDLGVIIFAFYLAKWFTQGIGTIGIILPLIIAIALITLRMSVMGQWMAIIPNENIKFSLQFKRGIRLGLKNLKIIFPAMLALNVLTYAVIMVTAVPTVLIIPLLVPPVVLVSFTIISLISYYYEQDKRKFYIDERTVDFTH